MIKFKYVFIVFAFVFTFLFLALNVDLNLYHDKSNGKTWISLSIFDQDLWESALSEQSAYTVFCEQHGLASPEDGRYISNTYSFFGKKKGNDWSAIYVRSELNISLLLTSNLSGSQKVSLVKEYHGSFVNIDEFDLESFFLKWSEKIPEFNLTLNP